MIHRGDTVRCPAGPWTPTVQRWLGHLRAYGRQSGPDPVGVDEQGREVLSHLPGSVPQDPMPDWVYRDDVLVQAAGLMAELHAAGVGFDRTGAVWQLPTHEPTEVICHNDFAPYNLVFDADRRLTGVIDWDTASPGPRVWDLAYLAYRLVPLGANPDLLRNGLAERRRRLALLLTAYGAGPSPAEVLSVLGPRLRDLADWTAERARTHPAVAHHVGLYRADAAWVEDQHAALS